MRLRNREKLDPAPTLAPPAAKLGRMGLDLSTRSTALGRLIRAVLGIFLVVEVAVCVKIMV
jgi:hypothetical protein